MKFIIILVLLSIASAVYCQGIESVYLIIDNYIETTGHKFREECIESSGVDLAMLEKAEKEAIIANDEKLKCYIQCQGIKSEVVDDKGVINMETLKKVSKATNTEFLDMVESDCKLPKHQHLCEAAYESCLCIFYILTYHHHLH